MSQHGQSHDHEQGHGHGHEHANADGSQQSQAQNQAQNLPFDDRLILDHPLTSPHRVKEAWRFISDTHNADRYPKYHVEQFKQMVQAAAREYGIELDREH